MAQLLEDVNFTLRLTSEGMEIERSDAYAMGCIACDWYVVGDERWEVSDKFGEHLDENHPTYPTQYEKRDYQGDI